MPAVPNFSHFPAMAFQHPRLPLPPPLMMSGHESFAHYTLRQRWPAVVHRAIDENPFPPSITQALQQLIQDLRDGKIRLLADSHAPDTLTWEQHLQPLIGMNWIDVPWFWAEVYFYRRILEAVQFFEPGPWQGVDPFASQKQAGLNTTLRAMAGADWAANNETASHEANHSELLLGLVYGALWGNQADLSLRPAALAEQAHMGQQQEHILVDQAADLLHHLSAGSHTLDLVADNAGAELIGDLRLVDGLLHHTSLHRVRLHLKAHPTFVSDATVADVELTLTGLEQTGDRPLQALAARLRQHMEGDRLQLHNNPCWTAPLVFWEMLPTLRQQFDRSTLVLMKGDANYRRLLGDRTWPSTTPFSEIVCYLPIACAALRTLKSEIIVGLNPSQIDWVSQRDDQWLTNGEWGVIQLADAVTGR